MSNPMEKSSPLLDNPNAPTIPHWWRVEEEIDLAGVFIMTVFYGIVIALFFQCMNALLNSVNRTRKAVKWGLMAHTIVMFSFVTIYTAINLNTQSVCYIDNRDFPGINGRLPPGPHAYLFFIHSKANFIPSLMFTLNQWLTDGLVLYRCCVIYSMNYWVIAFPCVIYLATLGMGGAWVYVVATEPNYLQLRPPAKGVYVSYFMVSFSLNVLLTLMIIVQLIRYIRQFQSAMGAKTTITKLHKAVLTMIVESFAIYAANFLLFIILFDVGNSFLNIFNLVLAETQVIAPFLIILRVAKRRALKAEAVVSQNVVSFRFGGRGESMDGIRSFSEDHHTSSVGMKRETPGDNGVEVKDTISEVSLRQSLEDL